MPELYELAIRAGLESGRFATILDRRGRFVTWTTVSTPDTPALMSGNPAPEGGADGSETQAHEQRGVLEPDQPPRRHGEAGS